MNESFYFDKINNEFFSILVTDYFMLDDNLDVAKNTTTSYSNSNQSELVNRIKRIENEDKNIISIPRLTDKERKDLLTEFLQTIDNSEEKERIENLYLNTERTIFNKKFDIESEDKIVDGWDNFKNEILLSKAESFLNLNNINTHSARVWELVEEGNITIDLTKDDDGNLIEKKGSGGFFGNRNEREN
ncbi:hypothetical protein [Aquimarina sp. Aq78]|uniref:hypothetical protein n=1 Tax=Aquimarina sp. Aq78 TaxID=1191889 RepID=UPI00131F311F|nr:hypothetical protein [Aquimarina sp. Aq78]